MRTGAILPVLTAALLAAAVSPAAESTDPAVEGLIARLGSPVYRERAAAHRALDALGPPALDALRVATRSPDAETRRRAADLVEVIELRLASARLTAPTPVELNYRDVPLGQVVADFSRRTGATLALHPADVLSARRVTAASGPVPFWEAIALLCRAAGVHEWDGTTPLADGGPIPAPEPRAAQPVPFILPPNAGRIVIKGTATMRGPTAAHQIVLLDGPGPTPRPEHLAGAVRVRCLPADVAPSGSPLAAGEVLLPLHVAAEPKLQLVGGPSLRIERAVDERGQTVAAEAVVAPSSVEPEWLELMADGSIAPGRAPRPPAAVRLRPGAARRLRELSGSVAAQVRIPDVLVTVENPLEAARTTTRGACGVRLQLGAVERDEAGAVSFGVALTVPPDVQPASGGGAAPAAFQVNGGVVVRRLVINGAARPVDVPPGTTEFCGLSLHDADGRRYEIGPAQQQMVRFAADGPLYQLQVTFRPPRGAGAPARLVFVGLKPATVEVPFTLRDILLP